MARRLTLPDVPGTVFNNGEVRAVAVDGRWRVDVLREQAQFGVDGTMPYERDYGLRAATVLAGKEGFCGITQAFAALEAVA